MPIPKCICCVCNNEVNKRQTTTHPKGRMCLTHQNEQMSVVREAKRKAYGEALNEYCQSKLVLLAFEKTLNPSFEEAYKRVVCTDKESLEEHLRKPTHFMDSCPLTKVAGTLPELTVENIFQDVEKVLRFGFEKLLSEAVHE